MSELYADLPIIPNSALPNNSVGFSKTVYDKENLVATTYLCYPGRPGVLLDTPRWKVKRNRTFYNEDGSISYNTVDYPNGCTDYCFCPELVEEYSYKFTNI